MENEDRSRLVQELQNLVTGNNGEIQVSQMKLNSMQSKRTGLTTRIAALDAQVKAFNQILGNLPDGSIRDDLVIKRDRAQRLLSLANMQYGKVSIVSEKKLEAQISALNAANQALQSYIAALPSD